MKIIKNIPELLAHELIEADESAQIKLVAREHSIAITPEIMASIKVFDNSDPIFAQYVPQKEELEISQYEAFDPIADDAHSPLNGLVHRYKSRALLKLTNACPAYCRFCFRREMVGRENAKILSDNEIDAIIEYLGAHKEINEVIFSGGDSLAIGHLRLAKIANAIGKISNIKILRIHSRVPIIMPEIIDDELIGAIKMANLPIFMVLHINHYNEFTPNVKNAIHKLKQSGITLLSQSVLLRGVNDDAQILADSFNAFLENGIKPYYLHHPDLARGTGHFQLNPIEGMEIFNQVRSLISGIGLPKYVLDIPGGFGKVELNNENLRQKPDGHFEIKDINSIWHYYPNIRL